MSFEELSFENAPSVKVTPPGPKSKEYLEFQSAHEGAAVSYPRGIPVAFCRGRGATLEDVDGNVYIDFFAGAGVMAVGHSNPEVLDAVRKQLGELTHTLDFPTPIRKALVETLIEILPEELDRVFFGGPTGSDAIEVAMKLARLNSGRHPMISFEGAYHGMTSGALSLCSGRKFKEDLLPLLPEVHFVPYAYCFRCPFGRKREACELDCVKYFDHVLEDPHSGRGAPAAVIVEPIQGEGGSVVPPDEFMLQIRESCDKHGVLLIADEIQSGLCRTGKMFSFEHSGTVPDIVTISKALGGIGLPLSCVAYKGELDTWQPGKHLGTFRGNMTAFAAGVAALRFMLRNNLADRALKLGESMLSTLKEIEEESKAIVGDVRGKGLMLGVEFVKDKTTNEPAPELAARVRSACLKRGLLIEIGGHYSNVARFLPPLVLSESLATRGLEIFAAATREVESGMR